MLRILYLEIVTFINFISAFLRYSISGGGDSVLRIFYSQCEIKFFNACRYGHWRADGSSILGININGIE